MAERNVEQYYDPHTNEMRDKIITENPVNRGDPAPENLTPRENKGVLGGWQKVKRSPGKPPQWGSGPLVLTETEKQLILALRAVESFKR